MNRLTFRSLMDKNQNIKIVTFKNLLLELLEF